MMQNGNNGMLMILSGKCFPTAHSCLLANVYSLPKILQKSKCIRICNFILESSTTTEVTIQTSNFSKCFNYSAKKGFYSFEGLMCVCMFI